MARRAGVARAATSTRSACCSTSWSPARRRTPVCRLAELARRGERDAPPVATRPSCRARFAALIDRCLARDPDARPASRRRAVRGARGGCARRRRVGSPTAIRTAACATFEREHRALFFGRGAEIARGRRAAARASRSSWSRATPASASRRCAAPACSRRSLDGRSAWPAWRSADAVPARAPRAASRALDAADRPGDGDTAAVHRSARGAAHRRRRPTRRRASPSALARAGDAASQVRVLATARSDFLGPARRAARPRRLRRPARCILLGPLGERGAARGDRRAGARRRLRVRVRGDGRRARRVRAARHLPLLQFALAELWEARDDDPHDPGGRARARSAASPARSRATRTR